MKEQGKYKCLEEQIKRIGNCRVNVLITERRGEAVLLKRIHLISPNGDQFDVLPMDGEQLHVIQTLWGNQKGVSK